MKPKPTFYLSRRPIVVGARKRFGYLLYDRKKAHAWLEFMYSSATLEGPRQNITKISFRPAEMVEIKDKKPIQKYTYSESLPPGQLPLKHDEIIYKGFDSMLRHVDALYNQYQNICYVLTSRENHLTPQEEYTTLRCFRLEDVGPPEIKGMEGVWCVLRDLNAVYYTFVFSEAAKPFDTDGFVFGDKYNGPEHLASFLKHLRGTETEQKKDTNKCRTYHDKYRAYSAYFEEEANPTDNTVTVRTMTVGQVGNTTVTFNGLPAANDRFERLAANDRFFYTYIAGTGTG